MEDRKTMPEYIGVGKAEAITGISHWTWRRWAYQGKITSVKLGRRLLIPNSEITRLVAENTRPRIRGSMRGQSLRAGSGKH